MSDQLQSFMAELEQFGTANDSAMTERPRRMLNITRDTGEFLAVLVRATVARRVLEIGTSNGYSTLWLADAARAIVEVNPLSNTVTRRAIIPNGRAPNGVAAAARKIWTGDALAFSGPPTVFSIDRTSFTADATASTTSTEQPTRRPIRRSSRITTCAPCRRHAARYR